MTAEQLARQLRRRLRLRGLVPRSDLEITSDEDIIDSYVTCSCCGDRIVNAEQLEEAVRLSQNSAHFLRLTDKMHGDTHEPKADKPGRLP